MSIITHFSSERKQGFDIILIFIIGELIFVLEKFQLSQLVVNTGGLGGLLEMISISDENIILPAILAIGFISAECEQLALAAISSKVSHPLDFLKQIITSMY